MPTRRNVFTCSMSSDVRMAVADMGVCKLCQDVIRKGQRYMEDATPKEGFYDYPFIHVRCFERHWDEAMEKNRRHFEEFYKQQNNNPKLS